MINSLFHSSPITLFHPLKENSMSVFLTSPRTSHDRHDLMATHPPTSAIPASHPFPPSLSTASPIPSMGPLRLSEVTTTAHMVSSQLVERREGGAGGGGEGEEGQIGLPRDLLERSGSVEYSSDGEEGEDRLRWASPMEEDGEYISFPSLPFFFLCKIFSVAGSFCRVLGSSYCVAL